MCSYERASSYESQINKLIFEKENRAEAPKFTYGVKTFALNSRFQLELATWSHITFENKEFPIVFVRDLETGDLHFRDDDGFHTRRVWDVVKKDWINDAKPSMCLQGVTTNLVYNLYQMSEFQQNKPIAFFNTVSTNWRVEDSRYGNDDKSGRRHFWSFTGYRNNKELEGKGI